METEQNRYDAEIIKKITEIVNRGNNAEVKKNKDGQLVIYEVKKRII